MQNFAYSDFHPTLDETTSGNIKILYDEDVIKQSIRSTLATVQGERVRSSFGSGLVRYLFEPMGRETADDIRTGLIEAISQNEPRVDIERVAVIPNFDNNSYSVQISLFISALSERTIFEAKLNSFAS